MDITHAFFFKVWLITRLKRNVLKKDVFDFIQRFDTVTVAKYIKINCNEFGGFRVINLNWGKFKWNSIRIHEKPPYAVNISPLCQDICSASSPPK